MVSMITGLLTVFGLFWGYQAISVNSSLGWIYFITLVIFASVKALQHYDEDSEYRVKKNKFFYLELAGVVSITGLIVLLSGRMLIS